MADIQKIVDAVLSVEDDNNKFGVLNGIIDADWHPDHLKPDSEEAYDKAIAVGAAELQGLSQVEKYDTMISVSDSLDKQYEKEDNVLSERFWEWGARLDLSTFKPDEATTPDESTEVDG